MAAGKMPLEVARKEAAAEAGISAALNAGIRPSGGVCYTGDALGAQAPVRRRLLHRRRARRSSATCCTPSTCAAPRTSRRWQGGLLLLNACRSPSSFASFGATPTRSNSSPMWQSCSSTSCRDTASSHPMRTVTSSFSPGYAGPSAIETKVSSRAILDALARNFLFKASVPRWWR